MPFVKKKLAFHTNFKRNLPFQKGKFITGTEFAFLKTENQSPYSSNASLYLPDATFLTLVVLFSSVEFLHVHDPIEISTDPGESPASAV